MPHVANLKMSMILRVPAVAHKSWLFSSSVCYELIFSLGLRHGVIRSISSTEGQQSTSSSGFRNIEVMDVNRVRVIGLNRPRQRNAVNRQTAKELYSAFRLFDEDDCSDVAVLYGKGGTFCAGYDLKELASASTKNGGGMDINEFLQDCAAETDVGPMVTASSISLLLSNGFPFLFNPGPVYKKLCMQYLLCSLDYCIYI